MHSLSSIVYRLSLSSHPIVWPVG